MAVVTVHSDVGAQETKVCHCLHFVPIYFGHLKWKVDSLEKTDAGRDWGQEEKWTIEDETAEWHQRLGGCEFEWTPGVGDGQGGIEYCDSWGHKESDMTERLNWNELNWTDACIVTSLDKLGPGSNEKNKQYWYFVVKLVSYNKVEVRN